MSVHEETQYIDLVKRIIDIGSIEPGRNGNTISLFGNSMRFSLANDRIPILTTKKTAWKTCLKELLWFISGKTDNKILQCENVHIWDDNASSEFMNSRGLGFYPDGILGPIYGYQWRHFGAKYNPETGECASSNDSGVDQLQQIVDQLKDPIKRNSRRLIMTAWNPTQLDDMALPPCHILCQFNVHGGNKLSCALYQRSGDIGLGVPFNIASYSFLTHLIARHCNLEPYEFVYFLGNAHIYDDHVESMKEQTQRQPFDFPTLNITTIRDKIDEYVPSDFVVSGYKSHEPISMKMRM